MAKRKTKTKEEKAKKIMKEQLLDRIDSSLETIQDEVTTMEEDIDSLRDLLEKGEKRT